MENKKCECCGLLNPINARFCRSCGSFFVDSSGSEEILENARINKQAEEIIELRKVLATLSNDNSSLANRFNNFREKNELLSKEILDKNKQISLLKKEKNSLFRKVREGENILEETKRNIHAKYIFLCIILVIALVFILCITSSPLSRPKDSLSSEMLTSMALENSPNDSLYSKILKSIASVKPIIGTKVEVRNAGKKYDATIISKETTYINPQIELISLIDGYVQLDIKFYSPDGLTTGNSQIDTPEGYSYTDSIYLRKNQVLSYELSGWGNDEKGNWSSGKYKIEIYYKSELIGNKEFTIIDN